MSAAVWACVGRFQHLENYPAKATWAAVLPPVACGGKPFQALPNRKAASPERFLVRKLLAVENSAPTIPNRISHVRIANFGFSVCCGFGLAVFSSFAISESARQS